MQFLSVNFSLNQKYYVEKEAFYQVIKKSFSEIQNIKTKKIDITIDDNGEQIEIIIQLNENKFENIDKKILKVSTNISLVVQNLIDAKPKNIQIKVLGDDYE